MDSETKLDLLKGMIRIRIIEEELANFYGEQEMRCPVHFCIGQEAVAVGVVGALRPEDTVMSGHRSHGHYLAKGGNFDRMVAELYGKAGGCASGKGGSMHLIDLDAKFIGATSIVAGTLPVAVGIAFANKLKNSDSISVVFFGDGATEEGLFYESVNFAALHKLPVLFVCENNLYSVYSPLNVRQPATRKIYKVVRSMGVPSVNIDGNDVESVLAAAKKGVAKIRAGGGPFLIEAATYRWLEHCGPEYDNLLGYRTEEEFLRWKKKDPIKKYEARLKKMKLLTGSDIQGWRKACKDEVARSVATAKKMPFPGRETLFEDVYEQ